MSYKQCAWLVRWHWLGDHASTERPVVAILRPRLTPEKVSEINQALYSVSSYLLVEQAHFSKRPHEPPYPAKRVSSRTFTCGHNPWLEAIYVREFIINTDPKTGDETLTFHHLDQDEYSHDTGGVILTRKGYRDTITQPALYDGLNLS
jgi:hypothetical protein